ncbi:MAG: hypothetical protein PHG85_03750 [Candidatus Altiarchaeota archaeon]|nr:hypothetical protein [Candidatus Altiarchaeota archaeon]
MSTKKKAYHVLLVILAIAILWYNTANRDLTHFNNISFSYQYISD